jgi:uncharacterized protein
MGIFLDSGFYLGMIHLKDENHKRAIELLSEMRSGRFGQIYTSNHIMDETATLVAIRTLKNTTAINKIRSYFSGDMQIASILRLEPNEEEAAWNLFEKINRNSKDKSEIISFTDCTNIVCCQQYQIEFILSFDDHFDGWITRVF